MYEDLLNIAKVAATEAGKVILKHYDKYELSIKADNSPLTSADLASNDTIFDILGQTGIEICSEERIIDFEKRSKMHRFWLIDPLDGTKEFISKNGEFCVCIALIEHGKSVLGVIYQPLSDEIIYSANGLEVYKNGEILKPRFNANMVMYTGRHSTSTKTTALAQNLGADMVYLGSAIKFCKLVEFGGVYARFSGSSAWDIAAGEVLVRQSGGIMIDASSGESLHYGGENLRNPNFIAISSNMLSQKDLIMAKMASC